ncbi:hypothetical protein ES319_A06G114200v1 [Gossypium barbadense]|uniref:peptidyl-tRNA hydrolase n=2 Tax=Gossypium TaxID=3633 RepID=A0A5J5VCZ6_GOSBA|nr:hypothetical protein ES319_A06G114200v1 [Gossypium barbadense]TYH13229.1 hypothetical protein ES288_A06G127800v1 [Gossypium darwinii]
MAALAQPACSFPTFLGCFRPSPRSFSNIRVHPSRNLSTSMSLQSSEPVATKTDPPTDDDVLLQYVVLRRDLIDKWPLGSVVTQGCHASVTLEVKGETQILNLSEKLLAAGIAHKLWIEHPENFPTCLATKPYPKSMVSPFFKKLKLCK